MPNTRNKRIKFKLRYSRNQLLGISLASFLSPALALHSGRIVTNASRSRARVVFMAAAAGRMTVGKGAVILIGAYPL